MVPLPLALRGWVSNEVQAKCVLTHERVRQGHHECSFIR